jgi:hypothetical protein
VEAINTCRNNAEVRFVFLKNQREEKERNYKALKLFFFLKKISVLFRKSSDCNPLYSALFSVCLLRGSESEREKKVWDVEDEEKFPFRTFENCRKNVKLTLQTSHSQNADPEKSIKSMSIFLCYLIEL